MACTRHRQLSHQARAGQANPQARRLVVTCLMIGSLVLTYALTSLLAGALGARARTEPQTGPRQEDPAENFVLRAGGAPGLNEPRPRQDDPAADPTPVPGLNIAAFVPTDENILVQGYGLGQQLQLIQSFSYEQSFDTDQIAAAAGYVLRPDGEQVVYARRYNGESVLRVEFVANPPSKEASHLFDDLAPRLLNSADFMDIAAGDLDDVADGAGHKHDEVVVAYATSPSDKWEIKVAVLDYTNPVGTAPAPDAVTTATASTFINAEDFIATQTTGTLPVDNALGVAVGDFDGDGRKEIAVAHIQDHQKMWVSMFRYTNNGQGNRSLVEVSSASQDAAALWAGTVDVSAGDFDGKGADELLVAGSQWKPGGDNFDQSLDFSVWQADGSLNMTRRALLGDFGNSTRPFSNSDLWMRVQVTPGLFKYDPANGFGVNRRQFAAAWNDNDGVTTLTTLQVSDDLSTISQINEGSAFPRFTPDSGVGGKRFSIAAVEGSTTSTVSPWGIALSNWSSTGAYWLAVLGGNGFQTPVNPSTTTDDPAGRFPVVAFGTCPAITLAPSELPGGQVGVAYSQTVSAAPAAGTGYTFAVTEGALPAGLQLNPTTGVLSGTPTQAGSSNFRITATGAGGCAGSRDYTVAIECPTITLAPDTLPGGQVGAPYSQTVSAAPGGTSYTFVVTAGTLPAGLSLDQSTGQLSGTPTAEGSYSFRVTATGFGACAGSRDYTITVACPVITVGPSELPGGQVGAPYSQQLVATPRGRSYTFAVTEGALPAGLTLNPTSGVLSGTPTQVGTSSFRVTATGAPGCSGSRDYTVTVACPTITLAPDTLPGGQVGTPYSQTVSAAPAGFTYRYAVTEGALPPGLTLNADTGALSGTPTAPGDHTFRITATGPGSCTGGRDFTLTIVCPTITLAPPSLPGGQVGTAYSQSLSATPGGTSYTFAVTGGTLPTGLTLNPGTGQLGGTPTAAGNYSFRVTATSATGCTGSRDYTVAIECPTITLAPETLPGGGVGTAYNQQFSATPGGTSYTFAVTAGTLPAGLSLDASTGQLGGTPSAAGSYSFRVTATGFGACSGARDYTVAISNRLTVTNTNDAGSGSLRQAIADAAPGDTVDFAPGVRGTVTLTSGQLVVDESLTIEGPGASRLSVSGNNRSRVFLVDNVSTVTISGLTVSDGNAASGGGLQVTDFSTLTLNDCTVSDNYSAADGGGIESVQSVLTVNNCAVVNNRAVNAGGGIDVYVASATAVTNSTVSGNRAGPQGGGGIAMDSAGATLAVTNSTVVNNSAAGSGGGVSVQAGTVDLKNSVVARNLTDAGIEGSFNDRGGNLLGGDPLLAPLAFYGGQTPTHAPLPDSPAIDAGLNDGAPAADQRGEPRPVGAKVDSGSVESRLFLVTNTNDDGAGSLRQAIADNNASATVAGGQVFFRIPGSGPHTIAPASVLPPVIKPVTIDGLTQPGASCAAWPPTLAVELDGTNAGASSGLLLFGGGGVVRGLVINRFGDDGVNIQSANNRLECNFVGTDAAGTAARGNNRNGVTINGAGNVVGGLSADRRNLISANAAQGIEFSFPTTTGNQVVGNYIGTNASGAAPLGNGASGVLVNFGAADNQIGGTNPGAANRIAFNRGAGGGAGVAVLQATGGGIAILGNAIYSNLELGIDLAEGANNGQAAPALTSATGGSVVGTLASTPASTFRVEFFANAACDPSGRGQGETFLGFQDVTTDAGGDAAFTFAFTPDVAQPVITATATNIATGDTSEFSACRRSLVPPAVTGETVSIARAATADGVKIAAVVDPDQSPDTLALTVTPLSGSGVTVSGTSVNADGEVRATLAASCTATASTFEVKLTDAQGASGTGTLTVNVTPQTTPPVIEACAADRTLTADATGQVALPDLTGEVRASDACTPAPLPVTQTPAPGTLLDIGTTTVTFTVRDAAGNEASCAAQVSVVAPCPAVDVGPLALPGGQVAVPYNQTVFATPGDRSYTFAVTLGALPPGVTLTPSSNPSIALLTGTPTQAGSFSFRVTATTAEGCTSYQDYTVTISACPVITLAPDSLPAGQVGAAYSQTVSAAPGGASYSYTVTAGALPPGLGLNAATGEISGRPTQAANVAFTVTATDANGCAGSGNYTLLITPALGCPPITLGALPDGTFGVAYNAAIGVTPSGNYRFAVTEGSLPPGLQLNAATGRVRGTPLATGRSEFTITATNVRTNCQGARAYGVTINDLGSR